MSELRIKRRICTQCGICVEVCPVGALAISSERLEVQEWCTLCGACIEPCPVGALSLAERERAPAADLEAYSGVWVFAEHVDGEARPVVFELIGKGRELADRRGASCSAVLLGDALAPAIRELSRYPLDRVYVAEDPALARFRSDAWARVLAAMIERERPEIVLCGATALGRALMPRVAALVRTGVTADCTGLEIDAESGLLRQTRPAFGGNIMATILCPDHRPQMATVRSKVLPGLRPGPEREVDVARFEAEAAMLRSAVEVIETHVEETGAQSIAEADVIVAGGRGVGSAGGFELIGRLARALGGAVGASRAAVDAGWMPYSHQVGQTGKTVQPKLYVACGISGAVQHLVGMQSAGGIIAINSDPRAPIFDVADVGLVGDLRVVVPRLVEAVERSRRKEAGR
ncbi:MAG: electron transfer flavoprotein subunit alpha [Candidatus Brocadiia bacterium]|nr:electron transfer flavoprotein subunit alpha [Candidatus Brocadiia bacterium]